MFLHLKNKMMDPPGGWYYIMDDGYGIRAGQFHKLVNEVKRHMQINKIETPGNLAEIIEDQICKRVPASLVMEPVFDKFPTEIRINDATRKAVLLYRKSEASLPGRKEIDSRRAICVQCQYNTYRHGCFSCSAAYKYVYGVLKDATRSPSLRVCDITACMCVMLCHMQEESIIDFVVDEQEDNLPAHCWMIGILYL